MNWPADQRQHKQQVATPLFHPFYTHLSLRSALVWVLTLRCAALVLLSPVHTQCESSSPHLSSPHLHSGPCQSYVGMGSLIEFQFSSAILFRNFSIFLHKILQWLLLWERKGDEERKGGLGRQVLPKCVTKAPRCVTAKRRHMWYALLFYIYISYIVRSTSCCPCQLTASDVCRRQLRSCRYTYGGIQIQIQTEIQMQIRIQSERKGKERARGCQCLLYGHSV